ncbi:MAG TPA: hypothetical protein VFM99_00600 [Chitinophagales bacterium]|nr:hypothetical protein [Chitinophagales bacterium]
MKFNSICYLAIIVALHTHTIQAAITSDKHELSDRIDSTVYVILNNNEKINEAIQKSFEKNWTLSEIKFISKAEYQEIKSTKDNLYIMLSHNEGIDGNTFVYENTMQVFYLVRSGAYRVNITGVPVAETIVDGNIDNAVHLLQDKISFQIAKEQEKMEYEQYSDAANSRINIVKSKALYISSDDLDKNITGLDAIKELYSGEVFIVSLEQMQTIVSQKSDNVAYVVVENFKSGLNYQNSKQVIDASTGMVLYFDESKGMKATGFSKSDFNALQK